MALVLSAPKLVLLAAELAAKADVDGLAFLAAQHGNVLRKELLLRILLTYLPAHMKTADYVSFIQEIDAEQFTQLGPAHMDTSHVDQLSDQEASKKVRKLRLQQLAWPGTPEAIVEDPLALFLIQRAYAVDEGAGSLSELPDLIRPFLDHSPYLRTWMVSTLLPLLRRNVEYHPENPIPRSLREFERLSDRAAVDHLLSQTGLGEDSLSCVGRDLRGLIGPWLYNDNRWTTRTKAPANDSSKSLLSASDRSLCPGWEQVLQWLTGRASKSWPVVINAIEQWDGPADVDFGGYGTMWLDDGEQEYLEQRYARAALASAYLILDTSDDALMGAHNIAIKIMGLLDQDPSPPLSIAASMLSPIQRFNEGNIICPQNTTYLRNDLLDDSNMITTPSRAATVLLHALILSAFILTRTGSPCTIRRAGELALLQNEREQKAEAVKVIHAISENGPKTDDKYWLRARDEILWLRDWGAEEDSDSTSEQKCNGVLGQVAQEFLEIEILKALLANTRYAAARSLYEDPPDAPLPKKILQDTIFAAAMNAYDNASNPNRTRGGLKKCNDIVYAFPKTIEKSQVPTRRIEALLKATHALSDYRLVLKKGEPFTPVVLRVHADPISIIAKVLEQNPKSYTRMQELLDLGAQMVAAGLTVKDKHGHSALTPEQEPAQRALAEQRVTAMCIEAALAEDDFETAYSFVVSRLATPRTNPSSPPSPSPDTHSWRAALQAGKYKRNPHTRPPSHLGTASANPEIRHLEQRLECLAASLRAAPAPALQEVLNAFRRAEEELAAAAAADAAREAAWDDAGDDLAPALPGAFRQSPGPARALGRGAGGGGGAGEDAPLSLFDLSRATALAAQKNIAALSGLQRFGLQSSHQQQQQPPLVQDREDGDGQEQRVRKRDQFRDAAVGTLTSGVGWLIGAPVNRGQESE